MPSEFSTGDSARAIDTGISPKTATFTTFLSNEEIAVHSLCRLAIVTGLDKNTVL
jgi:hypothetical protein